MFNTRQKLIMLVEAYTDATGLSESYVSRLAIGSWDIFHRLRAGKAITDKRAERVTQWFSNHWPNGKAWPKGVERPPKQKKVQAA